MAGPFPFLHYHERINSPFLNSLQVLNHAHAIFGPVADVYLSYSLARKFAAGIAEVRFGAQQLFAILNAAHCTMVRFMLTVCIAAHTLVLHTLIRCTKRTVHSARSNQSGLSHAWLVVSIQPKVCEVPVANVTSPSSSHTRLTHPISNRASGLST